MARIAKIRTNVGVPFPALVTGVAPITIGKNSGNWTINLVVDTLGHQVPLQASLPTDYLIVWDSINKNYFKVSIADLLVSLGSQPPAFDQAAGNYNVTSETVLLINKAVPAAHNINLPAANLRLGIPIIIKDIAGNAAANVATIVPNGAEKIDGLNSVPINSNYGGFKLTPLAAGGWYISP